MTTHLGLASLEHADDPSCSLDICAALWILLGPSSCPHDIMTRDDLHDLHEKALPRLPDDDSDVYDDEEEGHALLRRSLDVKDPLPPTAYPRSPEIKLSNDERKLLKKLDRRIIPLTALLYLSAYLGALSLLV